MVSRYRFSHLKVLLLSKKAELSLALSLLEIRESQSLAKQKLTARRREGKNTTGKRKYTKIKTDKTKKERGREKVFVGNCSLQTENLLII